MALPPNETTPWTIARDTAGILYVGGGTSWSATAPTRWDSSRVGPCWCTSQPRTALGVLRAMIDPTGDTDAPTEAPDTGPSD
ncbi:MAG: hypothetical protein ABEK84_09645 [Salinibacter sp.]